MNRQDINFIFGKCIDNGKSCRIAIKLKGGGLHETNAGDCFLRDEILRFPTTDERGKVFYNVDFKSIEYIKAYDDEWAFCKRFLKWRSDISIIPELWEAIE